MKRHAFDRLKVKALTDLSRVGEDSFDAVVRAEHLRSPVNIQPGAQPAVPASLKISTLLILQRGCRNSGFSSGSCSPARAAALRLISLGVSTCSAPVSMAYSFARSAMLLRSW